MGDEATIGYLKGFYICRKKNTKRDIAMLDLLGQIEDKLTKEEEIAEIDYHDAKFRKALQALPHVENLWTQGYYSSCGIGRQGGCNIGWHWKKEKYWKEHYNPKKKDLDKLKKALEASGFIIENETKDYNHIIAYEG